MQRQIQEHLLILLIALTSPLTALAFDKAPDRTILNHIKELSSPEFEKRAKAVKALTKIGKSTIEHLTGELSKTSNEKMANSAILILGNLHAKEELFDILFKMEHEGILGEEPPPFTRFAALRSHVLEQLNRAVGFSESMSIGQAQKLYAELGAGQHKKDVKTSGWFRASKATNNEFSWYVFYACRGGMYYSCARRSYVFKNGEPVGIEAFDSKEIDYVNSISLGERSSDIGLITYGYDPQSDIDDTKYMLIKLGKRMSILCRWGLNEDYVDKKAMKDFKDHFDENVGTDKSGKCIKKKEIKWLKEIH